MEATLVLETGTRTYGGWRWRRGEGRRAEGGGGEGYLGRQDTQKSTREHAAPAGWETAPRCLLVPRCEPIATSRPDWCSSQLTGWSPASALIPRFTLHVAPEDSVRREASSRPPSAQTLPGSHLAPTKGQSLAPLHAHPVLLPPCCPHCLASLPFLEHFRQVPCPGLCFSCSPLRHRCDQLWHPKDMPTS